MGQVGRRLDDQVLFLRGVARLEALQGECIVPRIVPSWNEGTDGPPPNRFEPHHITGVCPLFWTALNYVQRVLEVVGTTDE